MSLLFCLETKKQTKHTQEEKPVYQMLSSFLFNYLIAVFDMSVISNNIHFNALLFCAVWDLKETKTFLCTHIKNTIWIKNVCCSH